MTAEHSAVAGRIHKTASEALKEQIGLGPWPCLKGPSVVQLANGSPASGHHVRPHAKADFL